VLAGERHERRIEGFDFGNSPTEIIKTDLNGKTLILTTTAGTKGITDAVSAGVVLTGSIVNAGAVVRYIKALNPKIVTLVAMGYRGTESTEEDLLCADMVASGLKNESKDFTRRIADLRFSSGNRFFESGNLDFSPPTDFFLCTMADRFNFVLRGERRLDGNIDLIKIDI
jgi:2-phosphosulfolactate phosphatase